MEYSMKVMQKVLRIFVMVLLTDDAMDCAIFVAETEKSAIVDTACSITVADEQWLNNYI